MKRAIAILVAVLAILLVYPATAPSAKSPNFTDTPTIIHILPPGDGSQGNSGEDDEGDGDDLAGIKPEYRPGGMGGPASAARSQAIVWWMYFFKYVRIVF